MADKTLHPLVFGDSVADGIRKANKLDGTSRSGAGPREVRDMILSYSLHNSLEGRDVFIGTGIPNIPEQKKFIEEQIELVRKKGGRPILIGVGPGTEKHPTTGQNEFLAEVSKRNNLPFTGPLINLYPDVVKDPMGLHLRPAQYKQFISQFYGNAKPQQQPPASPQQKSKKFDPDVYLQDPNVNKFLDYINVYEGSPKANQMVGFKEFNDFRDHPRTAVIFNKKGDRSDAAGMFQILSRTWDGQRKKLGLTDFSLLNQKRAAVGILHDIGALPDIVSGNFDRAKPKAARQWASIPGSTIGLSTGQVPRYKEEAEAILGRPYKRANAPMMPRVEAPMMPRVEAPVEDYKPGSTLEPAPRIAQQGPATAPPQQDQVTRADMERMGPSYQAAFAAMSLADSREDDDEYDDDETIAERYLERRGEQVAQEESTLEEDTIQSSPLASLSEISYQSPFAQEEPVMMAHGGVVHRADGSPMYGEGVDLSNSGGITEDTRRAMATRHSFSPREALSLLGQVGREGVSNLESTLRGSVAAIPGFVGDVESGFRDDKNRRFMTTEEVKRDVLPSRMTAPSKDAAGYEELGTYLPLPVTPQQILPPSVVRNLITKAKNALPAKEVDTFPMGKLSAQEVLQQVKSFDPKALEKAREAFLASSAEKRRMYHGTLMAPEGKTVADKRLPDFYKTVGTDQGFTSFKPGTGGMTFVTPNPEFTDLFTGVRYIGPQGSASPSRVYPVYVQVKKPFDFENAKHVDELAAEVSAAVRKNKGKKDLAWWMTSGGKPVTTDSVRRLLSTGQWGFIEDPIVLEAAKKLGFDGMYMMEAGTKNLGIFDPKKIKSAVGNEGSFNVKTPDIRKAEGGIVHRANGSPIYGEVADTGPITADTRAAFRNMKLPDVRDAREALKMLRRIAGEGVSNLESMARGSVAGVPGVVGDIESIFRDDKKRKFATSTEVERDYLPKRMTAPTKESQGFVEIGTAIDPFAVLKAAKPTAKATLAAMKSAGPQIEATLGKMAPAAEPMYAVKPKGGVFYPQGSGSNIDAHLDKVIDTVLRNSQNIRGIDVEKVSDIIAKKGHKYFSSTFSTGDDPLREAILDGRIKLTGDDTQKLTDALLKAAREGSPDELKAFEEAYDHLTDIRGELFVKSQANTDKNIQKAIKVRNAEKQKMLNEGVSPEDIRTSFFPIDRVEMRGRYAPEARKMLADLLEGKRKPVNGAEEALLRAAKGDELVYDTGAFGPTLEVLRPGAAGKGIATLTIKDIERMSYPEMIIRGMKNTLFDRSGDAVINAVMKGKEIPKKFYSEGVTPVPGLEGTGWVSIDTPFAVKLEGRAMNHSVWQYAEPGSYGLGGKKAFTSGYAKVFSNRPDAGKPVTTVEGMVDPQGAFFVRQIKGPYNSLPTLEEKLDVFKLLDNLRNKYNGLDFQSAKYIESYPNTRTGEVIKENAPQVNWFDEYEKYLRGTE